VAIVPGADDWVCIANFAKHNIDWFRKFILLTNGVPSHDTIERVFKQMSPKVFLQSFMEWTQIVADIVKGGEVLTCIING
jgi:hypothetical protein